jgi:hypothetical protein
MTPHLPAGDEGCSWVELGGGGVAAAGRGI